MLINDILQPCGDSRTYTRHAEMTDSSPIINLLAVNIGLRILWAQSPPSVLWFVRIDCRSFWQLPFGPLCRPYLKELSAPLSVHPCKGSWDFFPQLCVCEVLRCFFLRIFFFLLFPQASAWMRFLRGLGHDSEYGVVAADARPDLFVVFLGVAHLVKLRSRCQHWSSEPHGVPLHMMSDDLNVNRLWL